MFTRRLFLSLILVAIPASADLLQVSVSGTLDSHAPVSDISGPNATWAMTFDIDSQPTVDAAFPPGFFVPVSNPVYDLNGAAVSGVSFGDANFNTDGGMAFYLTGSDGYRGRLEILGPVLFSGDTATPEILTGTFDTDSGAAAVFSVGDDPEEILSGSNDGPVVITDLSPVPEPRANLLLGTVFAATAFLLRRRLRPAAPRQESQG